jgi:hypothetical protein
MIFPIIKSEDKVFINDKISFDFQKSFLTPDESFASPTSHEASFDAGATWIDCTSKKSIDYIFATPGAKIVQLRITANSGTEEVSKTVTALDYVTQKLFSTDTDLYRYEPEIDNLMPKKWSSWNLVHLEAQKNFIDWLDEKRIYNERGEKYAVADLTDLEQVRQYSIFRTLEIIYAGTFSVSGDVFKDKFTKYQTMANDKLAKSTISLDFNKNGNADLNERTDLHTVSIGRQ